MDIGGAVVLGAIVAVGGGSIRDMALGRTAFWVTDPSFLVMAVTIWFAYRHIRKRSQSPDEQPISQEALTPEHSRRSCQLQARQV